MPASYPTSAKAFSVKAAGNTIQPADCNDLQDEVTAIETGLLTGTAPLNSSNSTVATLSVLGNSTIAGSLQVSGNSTIAGSLTVSSNLTVAGAFTFLTASPACRIFHGSTQVIPNAAETALTFNTHDFDPSGLHSTTTTPTRVTLQSTGVWQFGAHVTFGVTGVGFIAGDTYIRFRKNGVTGMGTKAGISFGGASIVTLSHTQIESITSTGDYVEILAFQNTGSTLQTGGGSSRVDQNEFWATKLR